MPVKILHRILPAGKSLKLLDFQALGLHAGMTRRFCFAGETCLVLLQGKIHLSCGIISSAMKRRSVFMDPACGAYIPATHTFIIRATADSQFALCHSLRPPRKKSLHPFVICGESLQPKIVGSGKYQRTVTDVLRPDDPAEYLLVGETFSLPGMWSSYPPHKHDCARFSLETKMEELYYYQVENPNRFGFQSVYSRSPEYERCYRVRHHDVVIIPFGFHPVCAPPDSSLYYLWALTGPKRKLLFQEDSQFANK